MVTLQIEMPMHNETSFVSDCIQSYTDTWLYNLIKTGSNINVQCHWLDHETMHSNSSFQCHFCYNIYPLCRKSFINCIDLAEAETVTSLSLTEGIYCYRVTVQENGKIGAIISDIIELKGIMIISLR